MAKHHLWCQVEDAPLRIGTFMGPVPPALIICHELRMLPIDGFPLGAADDVRIEHPVLHGDKPRHNFVYSSGE